MANRSRRSFARGKKNYTWTSIRIGSSLTSTVSNFQIVNDADWFGGAGQQSGTIIAVRGWFDIVGTGTADSNTMLYIGTVDEDVTSFADPNAAATYVDEDIMWTGGVGKGGMSAIEPAPVKSFDINIKVKRKIKSGTDLILSAFCNIDDDVRIIGIMRALILKGS